MSKGRLTTQELGWLLTQEAQGAASRLRHGVQVLRGTPPAILPEPGEPAEFDKSLDALDDVMRMLSSLHTKPHGSTGGRRGRIDIAAMLWEVAPDARVQIEPGSGTEVFGEEGELRRMLHVLVGHGSGIGSNVTVRREGADVIVGVTLGPDTTATAETERAWLNRMAIRYGGRVELEGATELLVLPADGERDEKAALRKELDEARKQGEIYARELAAVFEKGEEHTNVSSFPPPPSVRDAQHGGLAVVVAVCRALAGELRSNVSALSKELSHVQAGASADSDAALERAKRKAMRLTDQVAGLASFGELDAREVAREVDVVDLTSTVVAELQARAQRHGVALVFEPPTGQPRGRLQASATAVVVRELVALAVEATPRGSEVRVHVDEGRIVIDDQGTAVPANARAQLLSLGVDPGTYGRPSSLPLYFGSEVSQTFGATLELSDAPTGGLRVVIVLPF